jgi:putative nucleotidyltransferase with HDIG domain
MKRGLVVDDEAQSLQDYRKTLPAFCPDMEFDFVNGGAQALSLMAVTRYDVVVTDLDMPKMSGVELLSQVARQFPSAVRILLSGHSDWKTNLRIMGPAHECLSKPCSPRELAEAIRRAMDLRDRLKDERLKRLVSEIHALPSIPSLYLELLKALQDEEVAAERVARIVGRDMGMCAKMLQLVNSPVFGLPQPLADATEAVIYLGVDTVKSLVLSLQVFSLFERVSVKNFSYRELWTHSLATGVWAKRIAEVENPDPLMSDQSFTAGLLHDVGKLVLAQGLPGRFGKAIEVHFAKNIPVWEAEMEVFNATHAEVGAYLLGLWGLPDAVVEAVALHHNPGASLNSLFTPLAAVHAANGFTHENGSQGIHNALDNKYIDRIVSPDRVKYWREIGEPLQG